eukprot:GDKJ01032851.1.p1 GENE.GDKJ01032851.1~~GDKJ01032851.1.p1  ORF type:complete len:175 (-),score=33.13 GDKJ01032851.1:16-540(-)
MSSGDVTSVNVVKEANITLSSALPGNGVNELIDQRADTFWQTFGSCPHSITVEFDELRFITSVELYLDYKVDESFTPQKIIVEVGESLESMCVIASLVCDKPEGWLSIPFAPIPPLDEADDPNGDLTFACKLMEGVWCCVIRIVIESAHEGGKDIHIRQLQVLTKQDAQHLPFR